MEPGSPAAQQSGILAVRTTRRSIFDHQLLATYGLASTTSHRQMSCCGSQSERDSELKDAAG